MAWRFPACILPSLPIHASILSGAGACELFMTDPKHVFLLLFALALGGCALTSRGGAGEGGGAWELAALYGCCLTLGAAPIGGLRAELLLPRA
jgi:hypothetical protein